MASCGPVHIFRKLVGKDVTITYINGVTVTGKLNTFHLGQGIIAITTEKEDVLIMLSSIRSLTKSGVRIR